jgi:hypothetical protein
MMMIMMIKMMIKMMTTMTMTMMMMMMTFYGDDGGAMTPCTDDGGGHFGDVLLA